MTIKKIKGLVAAPFAPMGDNGNLNLNLIPLYHELLDYNKVAAVFINGTTGEGVSLSMKERQSIVEVWVESGKRWGNIEIINLVGGTSSKECIEFAKFSYIKGVNAIAVIAPYFLKPITLNELVNFIKEVADQVTDLPIYYYHIPVFTGVNLSMLELLKAIDNNIPNFAGIKYTHHDFMDFLSCLNYKEGNYDILWGVDEELLSALVLGCKGAVGSTYNYLSPLFNSLINKYENGDLAGALKLQQKANEVIYLLRKYGGIRSGKAFMRYIGLDCGNFRSPFNTFTENDYRCLYQDLKALEIDNIMASMPETHK